MTAPYNHSGHESCFDEWVETVLLDANSRHSTYGKTGIRPLTVATDATTPNPERGGGRSVETRNAYTAFAMNSTDAAAIPGYTEMPSF